MVKCSEFGVTVPLSFCSGARACWVRASPFGLLKVRTTPDSKRDGFCSTGVTSPGYMLHSGSVSGSAAAPVSEAPVPSAPANMTPPLSKRAAVQQAVAGDEFERRRAAAFAFPHGFTPDGSASRDAVRLVEIVGADGTSPAAMLLYPAAIVNRDRVALASMDWPRRLIRSPRRRARAASAGWRGQGSWRS